MTRMLIIDFEYLLSFESYRALGTFPIREIRFRRTLRKPRIIDCRSFAPGNDWVACQATKSEYNLTKGRRRPDSNSGK